MKTNNKEIKEAARQSLGKELSSIRYSKKISTYSITKYHGIRFEAIQAIENGSSNYTVDNLLAYVSAIGCSFSVLNKENKTK